jgi:hypothetical protein
MERIRGAKSNKNLPRENQGIYLFIHKCMKPIGYGIKDTRSNEEQILKTEKGSRTLSTIFN